MRKYAFRNLNKAAAAVLCALFALLAFTGCLRAEASNGHALPTPRLPAGMVSPSPEPTGEPTPQPTEYVAVTGVDREAVEAFAADELKSLLTFDFPIELDRQNPFADEIAAHKEELLHMDEAFLEKADEALRTAAARTAEAFGVDIKETAVEGGMPRWQLASAAAWACGPELAAKLFRSACSINVDYSGDKLTARLSYADLDGLMASATPGEQFTACFVYSYFLTVFDDDFEPADSNMPILSQDYIRTLSLPLEQMFYYDSWYGPRQYSTRYHLGMDIHSRPDSLIMSCTDGVVKAIGYDDTAGYYVVITDPFGYEYHYYHMIRLTEWLSVGDSVTRGEEIGNVGSTGNSDGYHLHLSIITPEHIHLNPYTVMCAVRDLNG